MKADPNVPTSADLSSAIQCQPLRETPFLNFLLISLFLLTGGLFYLPYHWSLSVRGLFYKNCSMQDATHIKVSREKSESRISKIQEIEALENSVVFNAQPLEKVYRVIEYNNEQFYLSDELGIFVPLVFKTKINYIDLHSLKKGLDSEELILQKLKLFGESIIKVPIPPLYRTYLNEILRPFFVFQIFSIILWCTEQYYWYSIAIFFIMGVTLNVNAIMVHRNFKDIERMALFFCDVLILRNGQKQQISSVNLVPGDILFPVEGMTFPCDLILLEGYCLVDETMLTGESQPAMKEAMPEISQVYNKEKLYTLSAGTKVVSAAEGSIALVISTGYNTAKGDLVRSILYPKDNRFKFQRDAYIFVGLMGVWALIGFFIAIKPLSDGGYQAGDIAIKLLDLITIAVPPALPLTMTIGIGYSLGRFKKQKIGCISQPAINSAGRVTVVCFDKTGTLTKDHMLLKAVYSTDTSEEIDKPESLGTDILKCLVTCNSLALHKGEFIGDPQEVAIIKELKWTAHTLPSGKLEFTSPDAQMVVSSKFTYHFTPELKRMAVVIEENGENFLFMKGAPEVILPLCKGVPDEIYQIFLNYTRAGYRVLACGFKKLDMFHDDMKLSEIETNLHLLALPLLENPIKDDAIETIAHLKRARIHCVISTGDNVLTALAVGKTLKIIPNIDVYFGDYVGYEIVWENSEGKRIDGLPSEKEDFELICTGNLLERVILESTEMLPLLKSRCKIFGRMAPKHKIMLIETFQVGETIVAMVGDGANDCGALKQADVGLSLSEAEASIAAPFCAGYLNSIIYVLREGRCALATSYQCFKFMMMYSVIQFTCTIMLYIQQSNLTNNQFLWQDVFNVLPCTFTMAASLPYRKLSKRLPPGSLISIPIITSVIGVVILVVGFIVAGQLSVQALPWYGRVNALTQSQTSINSPVDSVIGNVIFLQGSIQLIVCCFVFAMGRPFREPVYTNYSFCICIFLLFVFSIYLIFSRDSFDYAFVDLYQDTYWDYRWIILGIYLGGILILFAYEWIIVPILTKFIRRCIYSGRKHLVEPAPFLTT